MSEIFNSKRFGKYIITDLKNCWNNYGLSFCIMCVVPAIVAIFCGIWSLVISDNHTWFSLPMPARAGIFCVTYFALTLTMGAKMYGYITDKKSGSNYIMIPVSSFEKTLSMLLITIVSFFLFLVFYLCIDGVVCLFDKNCGDPLFSVSKMINTFDTGVISSNKLQSVTIWTLITESINTLFVFLFGAVYFKKSKAAKTILAIFIISSVIGLIGAAVIPLIIDNININLHIDEETFIANFGKWIYGGIILNIIFVIGVAVAIYFRVKTLKH